MTNYANGRRAEYLAKQELEGQGYQVIRSSGSHSAVDLVAWDAYGFRLIQIKKCRAKRKFSKELSDLANVPLPINAALELWARHKGQWHKQTVVEAGLGSFQLDLRLK